jgi:aldose 1-epimerase
VFSVWKHLREDDTMKTSLRSVLLGLAVLLPFGCAPDTQVPQSPAKPQNQSSTQKTDAEDAAKETDTVTQQPWGKVDGQEVFLYTLKNKNGLEVKISNWGATITELRVPDKTGKLDDITLGWDSLDGYLKGDGKNPNPAYFGGIIGRYCNRIAGAKFSVDGKEYALAKNNGEHHLHGGKKGWDKLVWKSEPIKTADGAGVKFSLTSPDGDEGYPGNVDATATYVLTDDNALRLELIATTDKATPLSLTNHAYFNLTGEGTGTILDHEVQLEAEQFTVADAGGMTTGEIKSVDETPLDFRKQTRIGERIGQLKGEPGGYDHNYVLREKKVEKPERAATVYDPKSGRTLDVETTEVGVQFYTGNYLDGSLTGKSGQKYEKHHGFCLEPQFFPDSPNKANFPSPILNPGETYRQVTVYRFGVKK